MYCITLLQLHGSPVARWRSRLPSSRVHCYLLIVGNSEAHRWDGLQRHNVHTALSASRWAWNGGHRDRQTHDDLTSLCSFFKKGKMLIKEPQNVRFACAHKYFIHLRQGHRPSIARSCWRSAVRQVLPSARIRTASNLCVLTGRWMHNAANFNVLQINVTPGTPKCCQTRAHGKFEDQNKVSEYSIITNYCIIIIIAYIL